MKYNKRIGYTVYENGKKIVTDWRGLRRRNKKNKKNKETTVS